MSYQVRTDKRRYFLLNDGNVGSADRYVGIVEWKGRGMEPETACETKALVKESLAKAQATRLCKSYQSYFDREGERWEVLQRQKREAERERKRIADSKKRIVALFRSLDRYEQGEVIEALHAAQEATDD